MGAEEAFERTASALTAEPSPTQDDRILVLSTVLSLNTLHEITDPLRPRLPERKRMIRIKDGLSVGPGSRSQVLWKSVQCS